MTTSSCKQLPSAFDFREAALNRETPKRFPSFPRASDCSARWNTTISRKRRPASLIGGMLRPGLIWTLLLTSLLGAACARNLPESPEEDVATPEEAFRFYDAAMQQQQQPERDPKNSAYIRELAKIMDRLKPLAEAGLLSQRSSQESQEELPSPLALQQIRPAYPEGSPREDKRSNYIGLCHFKICNMGRKRNPYTSWNPWNRT